MTPKPKGRPPGQRKPTARRHYVGVRLDDTELATAKRLGMGNLSHGIQRALADARITGDAT